MFLSSKHTGRERNPLLSVWHAVKIYKYMTWLNSYGTVGLVTLKVLENHLKGFTQEELRLMLR